VRSWRKGRRTSRERTRTSTVNSSVVSFPPNWVTRISQLIILLLSTVAVPGILAVVIIGEYRKFPWPFLFLVIFGFFAMIAAYRILFHYPSRVRIDLRTQVIEFRTLVKTTKATISDIKGYSSSSSSIRSDQRPHFLFYFRDGSTVEISGFTIRKINDLASTLAGLDIQHLGEEDSSYYPFASRRLKFFT